MSEVDFYQRGRELWAQGQLFSARACLEKAVRKTPENPEIALALADVWAGQKQFTEAIHVLEKAVEFHSGHGALHERLAQQLFTVGRVTEAVAHYRRALALQPKNSRLHSELLYALHLIPDLAPETIFQEHLAWARQHAVPPDVLRSGLKISSVGKIRVGYVSPDFRRHSVARFIAPILAQHDRHRFEITLYATGSAHDNVTAQLQAGADRWREVARLTDAEIVAQIERDGIIILVDLAGHGRGSRLGLFQRRSAPVQVTYLGYPNTTGLAEMDYRFTDKGADPFGLTEAQNTEKLIRLEPSAWAFSLDETWRAEAMAQEKTTEPITFGCFNNFPKISPMLLSLWARILRTCPSTRLLLKAQCLDDPLRREEIHAHFLTEGVAPERVELVGWVQADRHLSFYRKISIALDTFPYHGTTTTCEALAMEVPVVTWAGQTHVSRVGVSLLTNAGAPEWIAAGADDYVRIACTLAREPETLRRGQEKLRARFSRSSLRDAARLTREIEAAYERFWQKWTALEQVG